MRANDLQYVYGSRPDFTGKPALFHASKPPVRALASIPKFCSISAARALDSSAGHVQ